MSSSKKLFVIVLLLLLVAAIPASVYLVLRQQEIRGRAQPATTLSFDPSGSLTKNVGETFTLTVNIDTGANHISGAELHIQYDGTKLTGVGMDIASNPFLPVLLVQGSTQGGLAQILLGSQPGQAKQGTGQLATITFRAAASTGGAPTFIRFTTETRVAGTGEIGNVLASQPAPVSVTINVVTTPTPSPTPTPTPTPVTSPTPTTRSGAGSASPTPTRIATSSAIVATASPTLIGKGGIITVLPTSAEIPVTAEVGPTTALTVGGIVLFGIGLLSLLAL